MIVLNDSSLWSQKQIELIEQHYHGQYVLETCLQTGKGDWANFPVDIFYTDVPHPEGSHWFGMYRHPEKGLMICDGISAVEDPIKGLLIDDTVIYSRYRHDYRVCNGIMVDGGRDYFRFGGERMNEAQEVEIRVCGANLRVDYDLLTKEPKYTYLHKGKTI